MLILTDRRIIIKDISEQLGISVSTAHKTVWWPCHFLMSVAIHQDNVSPAIRTIVTISQFGWEQLPHPSYSPKIAPLKMFQFGLVLWHINHCRLFNAKSFFYIHNKYMLSKHFVDSIFFTQLNGFTYFYLIWIIIFTINYLFAVYSLSPWLDSLDSYISFWFNLRTNKHNEGSDNYVAEDFHSVVFMVCSVLSHINQFVLRTTERTWEGTTVDNSLQD